MGLTIQLAGQDITALVDEDSIQISDTLGQGVGTGGGTSSRAATCTLLTSLGPAASAVGAGTHISTPTLVRMGEILIFDASDTLIFGGYVSKIEDKTERTRVYTQLDCYDYWQHLDRIQVQQVYSGKTDIYIINDLLAQYAPWIDRSLLPGTGTYTFQVQNYKAITLQKVLAKITDVTGYQMWISPDKKIHYVSPYQSSTAPFTLSNTPDFITSFNFGIDSYITDDNAAINRVKFYGGKQPSPDFTQDLSTQANGSNKLFVLAYYPRIASDGAIHIQASSITSGDLVLGYLLGRGAHNQLKSQGGTADVLLNADGHTLTFDVAPTNTGPGSVTARYRYEFPMVVQLTDQNSYQYFGAYYDGVISDSSVYDNPTAVTRCRTLLTEQSRGLTTLTLHCFKPGLQAGQVLHVYHSIRGINNSYLIQQVDTVPLGAGNFQYNVTLGAWNWNLVDVLVSNTHLTQQAQVAQTDPANSDPQDNGITATAYQVEQMYENVKLGQMVVTKKIRTYGGYYARSSPVGDGHDAYPGLCTISS